VIRHPRDPKQLPVGDWLLVVNRPVRQVDDVRRELEQAENLAHAAGTDPFTLGDLLQRADITEVEESLVAPGLVQQMAESAPGEVLAATASRAVHLHLRPSAPVLFLDELPVLARLPGRGQHGQLPQGAFGQHRACALFVLEVVEDSGDEAEQAEELADASPGQALHPGDLGGVRGLPGLDHPLEAPRTGQVATQAPATATPRVIAVCPASVSRKRIGCLASVFPSADGGLRVSRKRNPAISRAQVGLRRPWLPETESWMRGQRSFYDPGGKRLGRSSYLDQIGSPLLTIDRTLVVEVVVPRAAAVDRPTREQMKEATRARWREWQRMLDEGVYPTKAALARAMGLSRAAVTRGLTSS